MCWISNGMQHISNKYATQISIICIGHFSVVNAGKCPFLLCAFTTSGVTVSEYFEMMFTSIEKYLLSGIACQRDMSKIALQSANTACVSNSINCIY